MIYRTWLENKGNLECYANSHICKVAEVYGDAILTVIRGIGVKGDWKEYWLMRQLINKGELNLLVERGKRQVKQSKQFKLALKEIEKISKLQPDYVKKIMCAPMLDELITVEVIEGKSTCYVITSGCNH